MASAKTAAATLKRAARVSPPSLHQPTVPAEQRLRRYEEGTPLLGRDEPRKQRDQGAVGPTEPSTADLAAKHRQLVTEDEDLGVLLDSVHPVDADQLEECAGEAVEER